MYLLMSIIWFCSTCIRIPLWGQQAMDVKHVCSLKKNNLLESQSTTLRIVFNKKVRRKIGNKESVINIKLLHKHLVLMRGLYYTYT